MAGIGQLNGKARIAADISIAPPSPRLSPECLPPREARINFRFFSSRANSVTYFAGESMLVIIFEDHNRIGMACVPPCRRKIIPTPRRAKSG